MGWFGAVRGQPGHWRSSAMLPFDRAQTTSYSTLIVTVRRLVQFCRYSKLFVESRWFYATPPAFDDLVGGDPGRILRISLAAQNYNPWPMVLRYLRYIIHNGRTLQTDGRTEGIYRANIASRGRNDGKTTSSGGESVGSGALPDCLDFRFCTRMAAMSRPTPGSAFLFTFMLCNLDSIHRADITSYRDKKLSYRRGTARHAMSVKTVLNVAETFLEVHLISPATGEWPSKSSKVIGNGTNRLAIWYFLLVVCSINVFILCHFLDTTTLRCTWLPVVG